MFKYVKCWDSEHCKRESVTMYERGIALNVQ